MRDYDFQPPKPVYPPEDAASKQVRTKRPVGLMLVAAATVLSVVGLGLAAAFTWGPATHPAAAPTGTPLSFGDETDPTETSTPLPTTKPEKVKAGELVPITMNAQFTEGLTIVAPEGKGWTEQEIINRPGQSTYNSADFSARYEVWQTGLYTSAQSDKSLTEAQLLRLQDECLDPISLEGEPEVYVLKGKDGTKLELLGQRATDCDGGEIIMYERLMPHSGTRIHIVLWARGGVGAVEDHEELMKLFKETTFTVP